MVGGVRSHTSIVKVQKAELPFESEAVANTVLIPRKNVLPLDRTALTETFPSQLSVAVGME
jgi:hypothetical protein